jgi:hypothetical protein
MPLAITELMGYKELPVLALTALRVSKSIMPSPETMVATNLPDLLIPPVQLDATTLIGEDEFPDSLGWARSTVGSPKLGD